MAKNSKLYGYKAVEKYLDGLYASGNEVDYYIIEGVLVDSYIINHGHCIEVFKETYINAWESGLTRHIYRKKVPTGIIEWLLAEREDYQKEYGCFNYTIESAIDDCKDFNARNM